jgi:hypothetical protein
MTHRPHTFRTITDADWAAMFRAHRARGHYHGNAILAKVRQRVAALNTFPPDTSAPAVDFPGRVNKPQDVASNGASGI